MHRYLLPILASLLILPMHTQAQQSVPYAQAKGIFKADGQDYCFDGTYHAKKNDPWLALVELADHWELQVAKVVKGRVKAQGEGAHYFIKRLGQPFVPGPVTGAQLTTLPVKNGLYSHARFTLNGKVWSWQEWGAEEEEQILSDGATKWVVRGPNFGTQMLPTTAGKAMPGKIARSKEEARDDYGVGQHTLLWAGDLNGDQLPELITYWAIKEAWGLRLWSGQRGKDGVVRFKLVAHEHDGCS
jgi:hypothetical protein